MEKEINQKNLFEIKENKFNINLLDTLENNNTLFNNLNHNYNKTDFNNCIKEENKNINNKSETKIIDENISDNYILNSEEIVENMSDDEDIQPHTENNGEKINCLSFKDFISKSKNKNKTEHSLISKSFSSNKINSKKILEKTKNKKNSKDNHTKYETEENIKKKKYSKERMELNKQRLNNLYENYKKIKNKIEEKKKELSKEEMKDCSFSPKINKYSKILIKNNPNYSKPIFLRNNNDRKEYYKKKHEVNFTHIPKINKKYNNKLDIYSRLYDKSEIKNENLDNLDDCPFRPTTNYNYINNNKNFVKHDNILKRKILLNEFLNQRKVEINNNENRINKTFTPNTSCTSKSIYSIKKERQYIFKPYFDKLNRMIIKKTKTNKSFNNIGQKKYIVNKLNINTSYIKNNNKSTTNNKSIKNDKPFLTENNDKNYTKNINNRNNNNNFNIIDSNIIGEKRKNISNENVITNLIDKINSKSKKISNKGICVNVFENCQNIKNIIHKNRYLNQ